MLFGRAVQLMRQWGATLTIATAIEKVPDIAGTNERPVWLQDSCDIDRANDQICQDLNRGYDEYRRSQ